MRTKLRSFLALVAIILVCTMQAHAEVYIDGTTISINESGSGTVSSDMTCTAFNIVGNSTLTINKGVTLTLNNTNPFAFFENSKIELHGTMTGSVGSAIMWMMNSYINVYLSDGAKYTVTGLQCMEGDNFLVYYGYDAATDGNGTVSVKNGSTDVTSTSKGYKTTTYTFTATPSAGYKFVNWTKGAGGEVLGTDASINVTCEQNGQYQVYANFEADALAATLYNLTLADGIDDAANWTISPAAAEAGETVTLTYAGTKTVKSIKVVKKEAAPATVRTLAEATAEDLGKIVGADGNIYDTKDAAEAAGTTAVAMIAYLPSSPEEATYTPGLAIALDDEGSMNWSTANSTCEGKSAVANAAWMLPSMYQWKTMLKAFGDNEGSSTGLNTALTNAGGTAVEDEDATYWSSSEEDEDNAWMMSLWEGGASWSDVSKSFTFVNVRACLAFEVEAAPTEDYVEFNDGTNTVKVAKMNLGATTIAESASSCYGNYYAWAATTTSANYISNTAPYYDSSNWSYTKYTSTDGLATLEDGDEVVKANMPGWHMPTKAEFKTLYAACGGTGSYVSASSISSGASYAKGIYWVAGATSSITIGGDKYNVNGILFVQDANHHVFFPAAGDFYGSSTQDTSSLGYYWSSSLNTGSPDYAYYLYFTSSSVYPEADGGRYYGYTIRPFKD